MNFNIITLIALSLISSTVLCQSFNYTDNGVNWDGLGVCGSGIRQSPINIDTYNLDTSNEDISITATGTDISSGIINNTNDYELKVATGNGQISYSSSSESTTWNLAQFHFHAPSEHTIDGTQYAL